MGKLRLGKKGLDNELCIFTDIFPKCNYSHLGCMKLVVSYRMKSLYLLKYPLLKKSIIPDNRSFFVGFFQNILFGRCFVIKSVFYQKTSEKQEPLSTRR